MKSNILTTLIVLLVITLGLMTEGNDYVTFEVSGNNLTIVAHQELNGSVVQRPIDTDEYWLYTNGNITTKQYGTHFEVTQS